MMGARLAHSAALSGLLVISQPILAHDDTANVTEDVDLRQLSQLMLGNFATAPDNFEQTIIDRRIAVSVDGETGIWFYSQMSTGPDQKVYRQRFHRLELSSDGDQVIQRSFEPLDANRFVDGWTRPEVFASLGMDDMKPVLGEGCEQVWSKDAENVWRGTVDPRRCEIFSQRRQTTIRIGADGYYQNDVFGTSERGFDADMNPVWGSKPGEYITLLRCQSHRCEREARALMERSR